MKEKIDLKQQLSDRMEKYTEILWAAKDLRKAPSPLSAMKVWKSALMVIPIVLGAQIYLMQSSPQTSHFLQLLLCLALLLILAAPSLRAILLQRYYDSIIYGGNERYLFFSRKSLGSYKTTKLPIAEIKDLRDARFDETPSALTIYDSSREYHFYIYDSLAIAKQIEPFMNTSAQSLS